MVDIYIKVTPFRGLPLVVLGLKLHFWGSMCEFNPWLETKIPHASRLKKKKNYTIFNFYKQS